MNAETKNMQRALEAGVMTPQIYHIDKEKKMIFMEYLEEYDSLK